jgi:hypothetical protein
MASPSKSIVKQSNMSCAEWFTPMGTVGAHGMCLAELIPMAGLQPVLLVLTENFSVKTTRLKPVFTPEPSLFSLLLC